MKRFVLKSVFALCIASLLGPFSTLVPAFGQEWVSFAPDSRYVDLNFWMENQTVYVMVTITFPTPCHNVSDWGQVTRDGYSLSVNSEIWRWTGICVQIIWPVSHTYDLGCLEEGYYAFTFKAWGFSVKSIEFTVGQPKPVSWVKVAGCVDYYGVDSAFGWLNVFAAPENWAQGWCAFVVPPLDGSSVLIYPPPPINFTIYVARIVNASAVKLDHNGTDFWLSGFWEVGKAMNPTRIEDILDLVHNTTVAEGRLNVTDGWSCFVLTIEGLEAIQGNITAYCMGELLFPWEPIPTYDVNCDYKINIRDIAAIARGFGSAIGANHYNFYADFNFDVKIDMRDIATCARFFGKAY